MDLSGKCLSLKARHVGAQARPGEARQDKAVSVCDQVRFSTQNLNKESAFPIAWESGRSTNTLLLYMALQ